MKAFFDTSVLVPVFMEDHEHHPASLKVFVEASHRDGCCAAHSLAEVYSTLTRLPGRHRLAGEQVMLFLEDIRERLVVVSLGEREYYAAIKKAAAAGIVGGTIYDALLAHCAVKVKADTIYTWNIRHFEQFGQVIAERLRTP